MKYNKSILIILLASFLTAGCEQLLDVESPRLKYEEDHQMSSASDTIYAMLGIFSHLQQVADSYVLLGELRGELMDVTSQANLDLQAINNFQIEADNPYADITEYYAVINNCNYLINYIDTAFVSKGQKRLLNQFAAAKGIRAWTYMQIALNFGKAKYYEEPIITLEDSKNTYPEYSISELADLLIADLLPYKNVSAPSFGGLEGYDMHYSFFPIRMLLGDLYLWSGNYESAANEYRDLMYRNYYIISDDYTSSWSVVNTEFDKIEHRWDNIFWSSNVELITAIVSATDYGKSSKLLDLSLNDVEISASAVAKRNWAEQIYFHDAISATDGDLRGEDESYMSFSWIRNEAGVSTVFDFDAIMKFFENYNNEYRRVRIYRVAQLYLRYAEAVNRLGKPNLAFAVLKNGLNNSTLRDREIIPLNESAVPTPNYMNFEDVRFRTNVGIRMRGLGNVDQDTNYVIPPLVSLEDSIVYVEDLIVNELALETAFEGNRFQDLMRVALRRDDPSYLANIVAEKYESNHEAIKSKLMNTDNWYLPLE